MPHVTSLVCLVFFVLYAPSAPRVLLDNDRILFHYTLIQTGSQKFQTIPKSIPEKKYTKFLKKANSAAPPYARSRSYATTETKFPVPAVRRRHPRILGTIILSMFAYFLIPF